MKTKLLLAFFVALFVSACAQSVSAATAARLVSEWKFEDGTRDTSGNGNDGARTVDTTFVPGRFGRGIYLNRNDLVRRINATNLPVLAADSWSCNQWLYLTNAPDSLAYFAGFGNPYSTGAVGTARGLIASNNPVNLGITSWGNGRDLASGIAYPLNEWVMITITHNGANGSRTIWINGANATNAIVAALATAPSTITIGDRAFATNEFQGIVDEFTIWRGVLSAADIQSLTNGTLMIAADPQSLTNFFGQAAQLTGAAVSALPVSYQWLKNGAALAGATSNVLSFASLVTADGGSYSLIASNASGSVTSAPAILTVVDKPLITANPQSITRYTSEAGQFAATAIGPPLTYFWLKNGAAVPNATNTVLSFVNLSTNDAGNYVFVANNSFGSTTSAVATLTVIRVTGVTNALASYWNFDEAGGSALIDLSGNGNDGTLINHVDEAEWVAGKIGGGLSFGGPTKSNYIFVPNYPKPSSTMTVSAWVWADARPSFATIVKNWADAAGQQQFHFGIDAAPSDLSHYIKQQNGTQVGPVREGTTTPFPTNSWQHVAIVCDGAVMRLYRNGAPVGAPVAYNGTLNTNPIPASLGIGAKIRSTNAVDSFWQGKMDDMGFWTRGLAADEILAIYVAGAKGNPLTDAVTGNVAPLISATPQSQTVTEGNTASFSVFAAGTPPLSYQWRKNGANIAGATNSTLGLTNNNLCAGDGGDFTVVICNGIGCTTSAPPATLTIAPLSTTPITNGLFGYWKFDETNGTVAGNSFGAADNGTLNNYLPGDNSQWVGGRIGGALNFGGPASSNYVRVATYPKPTNAMSAAAWVWADARPQWASIVKNWGGGTVGQFHFGLQDTFGDLSNFISVQGGGSPTTREGAAILFPTNSWQHVAFTADGATMRIFRNGAQVGSVAYSGNLIASAMAPLAIGVKLDDTGAAPAASAQGYWQGKMDDLGLWSRGLSAAEVQAIYNAGLEGRSLAIASLLPSLQIVRSGTNATISWPASPAGNCFNLEAAGVLSATATWSAAGAATLATGRYSVTVSTTVSNRFFRLRKQ